MSVMKGWTKQDNAMWSERVMQRDLPKWLRVAALAYCTVRANGHAELPEAYLSYLLGEFDDATGECVKRDGKVARHIAEAVAHGFLSDGSTARCLRVPEGVRNGLGSRTARCRTCEGGKARRRPLDDPLGLGSDAWLAESA